MTEAEEIYGIEQMCFDECWSLGMVSSQLMQDFTIYHIERNEKGKAVGYFIGTVAADEAELHRIGVVPELRGKGIGKRLMEAFLKECKSRGAVRIFLEVNTGNKTAIYLYEKFGFKRVGVRKGYYNGENGAVMAVDI